MELGELQDLLVENEGRLFQLKQTYSVSNHTNVKNTVNNPLDEIILSMKKLVNSKHNQWETIAKLIDYFKMKADAAKKDFEESLNDKNDVIAEKAYIYQRALLRFNQAVGYGMDYLRKNGAAKAEPSLTSLAKLVQHYIARFTLSLETIHHAVTKHEMPLTKMSLHHVMINLSERYELDYKLKYGSGFWRRVKDYFRNTDRKDEIGFLKAVSERSDCSDEIRLHAMKLVRDKIKHKEFFGGGSLLRERLDFIIDHVLVEEKAISNLYDFCKMHSILMPNALKEYLQAHAASYSSQIRG